MHNLAKRSCTSPSFLAPKFKIFITKFSISPGKPQTYWTRGRYATVWARATVCPFNVFDVMRNSKDSLKWGRRVIGISGSLIRSKLIFNPCEEFRWSLEGPVSQNHTPHLLVGDPGIFSDLLRSVQMLKREWGVESNGKLSHLFITSKTATMVPEFVVKYLSLGRTAALVPSFAEKDLHLGRTLWDSLITFFNNFSVVLFSFFLSFLSFLSFPFFNFPYSRDQCP